MDTKEAATNAIVATHGTQINGYTCKCSWGKETESSSSSQNRSAPQQNSAYPPAPVTVTFRCLVQQRYHLVVFSVAQSFDKTCSVVPTCHIVNYLIKNWSHITIHLGPSTWKKPIGSFVLNRIGMKFGWIVLQVNTHWLSDSQSRISNMKSYL